MLFAQVFKDFVADHLATGGSGLHPIGGLLDLKRLSAHGGDFVLCDETHSLPVASLTDLNRPTTYPPNATSDGELIMWSKSSKHSIVAGTIEAVVAAGTLILSSMFVVTLAFPQPGYAQITQVTTAAGISKVDENRLALTFKRVNRNALVSSRE